MQKPNYNTSIGTVHMVPMDVISGFEVRPGLYEMNRSEEHTSELQSLYS